MEFSKARVGDVAEIERRSVPPTKIADGSFYVGLEHINGHGSFEQVGPVANGDLSSNKFAFNSGHVLFGKLRPYLRKTARPDFEGVCSTDILPLRPKAGKLDRAYLYHALRDQKFIDLASLRATGVNLPRLSPKLLADLEIPLPSLEEQRRIAAILDKADALRAKRREAIAKLDQLLQSVFLEMFGDPIKNPMGWDKAAMGKLMRIRRGGSPRPISDFLGGTHHWVKIGDATKGDEIYITGTKQKITEDGLGKTVHLEPGSLIFANCGVSLGFARILSIEGCIHDGWLAFDAINENRLRKIFLLKALNGVTRYFRKTAPSGTQPNLNTGIMKRFPIIVPPVDLQERFERIVESINMQRLALAKALRRQEELFVAIQQKSFNVD